MNGLLMEQTFSKRQRKQTLGAKTWKWIWQKRLCMDADHSACLDAMDSSLSVLEQD